MFIIILLCFFSFGLIMADSELRLYDYNSVIENPTGTFTHPYIVLNSIGLGIFNFNSFIVLIYFFLFMVSLTNLIVGKKDK